MESRVTVDDNFNDAFVLHACADNNAAREGTGKDDLARQESAMNVLLLYLSIEER